MQILRTDDPRWLDYVAQHPAATPFHHPAWLKTLAGTYGFDPLVLAEFDRDDQLVAGLPSLNVRHLVGRSRLVSLPFTDYCAPLSATSASFSLSTADLASLGLPPVFELRAPFALGPAVHTIDAGVRHITRLDDDPERMRGRISKMHMRNTVKAKRDGVVVRRGGSQDLLRFFYPLHLLTRRRLGVPIQPVRFFRTLGTQCLDPGLGFVLTAFVDERPAASAVFLAWNRTLIYKFGASDPCFWNYRPNNLLFWTAISWGCAHGFQTLDWGRTDSGDMGLREFKSRWDAVEEPLTYSIVGDAQPDARDHTYDKALAAVIRRAPATVCRILGEALYRYAA